MLKLLSHERGGRVQELYMFVCVCDLKAGVEKRREKKRLLHTLLSSTFVGLSDLLGRSGGFFLSLPFGDGED